MAGPKRRMATLRVHFMRSGRVVAAFIGAAFVQDDTETAKTKRGQIADWLRPRSSRRTWMAR
jgi:hypothetical protein